MERRNAAKPSIERLYSLALPGRAKDSVFARVGVGVGAGVGSDAAAATGVIVEEGPPADGGSTGVGAGADAGVGADAGGVAYLEKIFQCSGCPKGDWKKLLSVMILRGKGQDSELEITYLLRLFHENLKHGEIKGPSTRELLVQLLYFGTRLKYLHEGLELRKVKITTILCVRFLHHEHIS